MNIKNSVLDYIRLNWYANVRRMKEYRLPKKSEMMLFWKKKKGKTSKFVDS